MQIQQHLIVNAENAVSCEFAWRKLQLGSFQHRCYSLLISAALFLPSFHPCCSATVQYTCGPVRQSDESKDVYQPLRVSARLDDRQNEESGKEINNFWRQIFNCFCSILTLIRLKYRGESVREEMAATGIWKVDGKTFLKCLNVYHGPLSGRSATPILYLLSDN